MWQPISDDNHPKSCKYWFNFIATYTPAPSIHTDHTNDEATGLPLRVAFANPLGGSLGGINKGVCGQ